MNPMFFNTFSRIVSFVRNGWAVTRFNRLLTRAALLFAFVATCGAQQTTVPAPTPWTITSRSANSRIWQRTTYELSPSGQAIPHLHQYTELGTGICYQQPGGDCQWLDSQEIVNVFPDGSGASATNGQYQVFWPVDLYEGKINLFTPDGLQMASQPSCLCYCSR
ncbi:MAG TPA: hypothetical protein VNV43_12885 [Candidatus Acidoferrales bacterium]|jgi:hypothetical protein|nr:hypothetical protein [Candidatus Acidoferrales bacterium]